MAGQLGRSVLIKVEDSPGAGTYTTLAGVRTTSLTINNEIVDITSKEDNGVRKLLEGAGINSIAFTGAGVFKDDAAFSRMRTSAENNTHLNYQVTFPGDTYARTYTGAFAIPSLELAGEYNGEMTYSVSMESAGTVTKS